MTKLIRKTALLTAVTSVAIFGFSSVAYSGPIEATYFGEACPGTCTNLADAGYTVSGGAVVGPPAEDTVNRASIPGSNTGNADSVESFNVTSVSDDDLDGGVGDASSPIIVTELDGMFSLYWGSIDEFNIIDFYLDGSQFHSYTGENAIADGEIDATAATQGNYNVDGYFGFQGDFDEVRLSTTDEGSNTGIAFEVAATVPEPGSLALLGLGLAGLGMARRRRTR